MPTLSSKKWISHLSNYGTTSHHYTSNSTSPFDGVAYGGDTLTPDTFNLTSPTYVLSDPWGPPPAAMAEPWNWKWDAAHHQWTKLTPTEAEAFQKGGAEQDKKYMAQKAAQAQSQMKYIDYLIDKVNKLDKNATAEPDATPCSCNRCGKKSKLGAGSLFGSGYYEHTDPWYDGYDGPDVDAEDEDN